MLRIITKRLIGGIPILILVSLMTFGMMRLIPGDPSIAIAGVNATPAQLAQIRSDLGLDQPLPVQLFKWCLGLARGDLGTSLLMGQDVVTIVLRYLPVTIGLSIYALVLTLLIGIVAGIISALRQNTWVDQISMVVAMLGISLPSFFLGLLMIMLFAVKLRWLPTGGYIPFSDDPIGWLRTCTMPALSLAFLQIGLLARITRSTMLEVLRQDFIRTARAKGLPEHLVIGKHALANALIPITTVVGIIISLSVSGAVVTEMVFSVPGIGQVLTQAVLNRDYPLVQGGLLITTVLLVFINILIDVCYSFLDPRVRRG